MPATSPSADAPLRALVVDDEAPTLAELTYLLRQDPRVGQLHTASSGTEALRALEEHPVDVVFCDISMPGLDGLDLAKVLARFADRPQVVFVTAYEEHAVDAFELQATDYVMKPIRAERLRKAVRRACAVRDGRAEPAGPDEEDEVIPVELGGVTRFVRRSRVRWVEAHGDYARLHTDDGERHLIRTTLSVLAERWSAAGFVRVHRSALVRLARVDEMIRSVDGHTVLRLGADELTVSRRHYREVRDRLASR